MRYTRLMKRRTPLLIFVILIGLAGIFLYSRGHSPAASTDKVSHSATAPQSKPAPGFDKKQFSTSLPTSPWVIVNKQHPLQPKTYIPPDLTPVGNGQYMRAEAAAALSHMFDDAKAAGLTLTAGSGYRSYDTQVSVYASEVRNFGQTVADSESARPGFSEHQTGWAIDISGGGCNIEDCFGTTPQGKWVAANAYKYGFIQRYTTANSASTGYRAESWHFRYVGPALAQEFHDTQASSLETFFGVSGGPNY